MTTKATDAPETNEQHPRRPRVPTSPPQASSGAPGPQNEAPQPDAPTADSKTARQKIANLLWWSIPSSTDQEAKTRTEQLLDEHRAEVLAEVTTWLIKKAREFHASSRKREREQGDTCAVLASKIARGAVRPNNCRMLPNPGFFEVARTYSRPHHGETITFVVEAVSTSPDGRTTVAHGWRQTPYTDGGWEPTTADDFTGWAQITEGASA